MFRKLFSLLSNLKFALFLLLIIALFSSIGSFVEQNREILFYENSYKTLLFGIPIWKIILFCGFDNVYSRWWFFSILLLLGISLGSCTIIKQFPTLKFSRRYYFYKSSNQFNKLLLRLKSIRVFKSYLSYLLVTKHYSLFYQYYSIYAYKGLISRVGPIIVHLSLICILVGSTLGAIKGFSSQELIPKTELFHIQNVMRNGQLAQVSQNTFRVNDFWTTYKKTGEVNQFYSDISLLNSSGFEIKRRTICVNNPFLIKNLVIYQTDWAISGIRGTLQNRQELYSQDFFQLPVLRTNNVSQKFWVSSLLFTGDSQAEGIIIIIPNNRGQFLLFNSQGEFIKTINLGETMFLENERRFNFIDIIPSTGIQIKSDPGIKIIYFGFFFLILSSLISYLSFSEIWVLKSQPEILVGGRTNRSKILLNIDFLTIKQAFLN